MKLGCQARAYGKGIYPNEADFLAVVRQIGNLGFRGLEANWKNLERYFQAPEAFKRILAETNLELIGAHYGAAHWDESSREQIRTEGSQIADFVSSVGGQYIVCSGRRPTQGTVTDEMWKKTAEGLNLLGKHCAPKGIQLAYHNHWWESEQEGLVKLASYTDPAYVGFAFDTGHHIRAGKDAIALVGETLRQATHHPPRRPFRRRSRQCGPTTIGHRHIRSISIAKRATRIHGLAGFRRRK